MSLELHNLKADKGSRRSKKRVGRGNASGHGTTATRGTKGQRARQGGRRGLIQLGAKHFVTRLPKVRGFKSFKSKPQVVMLSSLEKISEGTVVTSQLLLNEKLIHNAKLPVKIIGKSSKLPTKLVFKVQAVTAGAKSSIASAGGSIEIVAAPGAKK